MEIYGSYGGWWAGFGAVGWQPTGVMVFLGRLWGCSLATYGSHGGWWAGFGAVGWQPTGLIVVPGLVLGCRWWLVGRGLGL